MLFSTYTSRVILIFSLDKAMGTQHIHIYTYTHIYLCIYMYRYTYVLI